VGPPVTRPSDRGRRPRAKSRAVLAGLGALVLAVVLTGCSPADIPNMLGIPDPHTDKAKIIFDLWQGSWVAAWLVGILVWGLIIWAVIVYRRRGHDAPPQTRYNLPIEVFYTAVPLIMVAVFFYFTARDEDRITATSANPDHRITVTGIQWSWQFTYTSDSGPDTTVTGTPGKPPTLYLPQGESVQFRLESNDVIHSFWVPAFLFKMDVIPGRVNTFEITPKQLGRFRGRCAELCGQDHARMLFNVKVVTPTEYQDYLTGLEDRLAQGSAQ